MYTITNKQICGIIQFPCKIYKTYIACRKNVEHKKKHARNNNVNKSRKV